MRKLLLLGALMVSLPQGAFAQANVETRVFGAWTVGVQREDMEPKPTVWLETPFYRMRLEGDTGPTFDGTFGFIIGSSRWYWRTLNIVKSPLWPHCDLDSVSYKIDDQPVAYMPMVDDLGECKDVLPTKAWVGAMQRGNWMKLKLYLTTGHVSLDGFTDALTYAQKELGR